MSLCKYVLSLGWCRFRRRGKGPVTDHLKLRSSGVKNAFKSASATAIDAGIIIVSSIYSGGRFEFILERRYYTLSSLCVLVLKVREVYSCAGGKGLRWASPCLIRLIDAMCHALVTRKLGGA